MAIDMASVYAAKYRKTPDVLRAAVMGQSPDKSLDSYTALNALKLVKEADMMDMAGQAQQPTSSPSLVAQNMAPPPMQQGLGAMVPGAMGQTPQGMPPQQRAPMPQPTMQAASGGLAGMYTPEEDFAEGGIVAFKEPTEENNYSLVRTEYGDSNRFSPFAKSDDEVDTDADTDVGTGDATKQFNAMLMKQIAKMQGKGARTTSPDDIKKLRAEFLAREVKNAGPDIYEPEIARGAQEDADRAKRRNTGEAMALLTAAGKVLKGRNIAEGASEALPAYAGAMGEVDRADQAIKSANAKMQFALKDAQRKERAGNNRAADAAMENYRKFQQDENKAEFDRDNAVANLAAKGITGNRTTGKGAGGLKYQEQILQNNVDYFKSTLQPKQGETPEAFDARVRKMASDETARALKTSFSTGEIGAVNAETRLAPVEQRVNADVINKLQEFKDGDRAYRAAKRKNDTTEANRLLTLEENRLRALYQTPAAAPAKPSAAPKPTTAAPKPTTTTKVVSMADVNATVASSGRTKQEVMDALKANGYTVK
jgi:hypothetical protein